MNQSILVDQIADDIIANLFINGARQEARRLILELEDGRNGGGWGKLPARDLIYRIIKRHLAKDDKFIEGEAREV